MWQDHKRRDVGPRCLREGQVAGCGWSAGHADSRAAHTVGPGRPGAPPWVPGEGFTHRMRTCVRTQGLHVDSHSCLIPHTNVSLQAGGPGGARPHTPHTMQQRRGTTKHSSAQSSPQRTTVKDHAQPGHVHKATATEGRAAAVETEVPGAGYGGFYTTTHVSDIHQPGHGTGGVSRRSVTPRSCG